MEISTNAYGMNQGDRGDWADSIEGVEIVEPGGAFDHEYLFFVGCAGSFDDRNKKTSRALANCYSAPRSTSRSSARARCATAIRRAARATSTSSRCSRCRTSRRSKAWE